MAEIVNLRRTRKSKARAEKAADAEANRAKHGVAKPVKELARARAAKEKRDLAGHRLEPDTDK
jgi:hypothetical protein